ncbi:hypothetical protein ACTA71_006756, partial [Dictyostelium dimigraforme]
FIGTSIFDITGNSSSLCECL